MYVTAQLRRFHNELNCPASVECVPLKYFLVKSFKMLFLSLLKSILCPGRFHVFVSTKLSILIFGNTTLGLGFGELRMMRVKPNGKAGIYKCVPGVIR
jgi:hypothetical protein